MWSADWVPVVPDTVPDTDEIDTLPDGVNEWVCDPRSWVCDGRCDVVIVDVPPAVPSVFDRPMRPASEPPMLSRPIGSRPRRSGTLNVVVPFPAPYVVPIAANSAG